MVSKEELIAKSKDFERKGEKSLRSAWAKHKEFLKIYPFREHPEDIELLTPEKIYNPGEHSFLRWIEHGLIDLAHLRVGSALYAESARDNPDKFKELLRTTISDSLSIAEKIDSHWEDIKGFGGEKTIAKKILFCYYPDKMLPILKTGDFEHFASQLGIDYVGKAPKSFGKYILFA